MERARDAVQGVSSPSEQEARDGAGRLGLLGHGTYYLLLTMLTFQLAFGGGNGEEAGAHGAIATVAKQPFGQVLLAGLTLAFLAYAVVRWARVFRDDDDAFGVFKNVLKSLVWTFLTFLAGRALLDGLSGGSGGGSGSETGTSITQAVLSAPGGQWVIGAVGLFLIGVGLYQVRLATDDALGSELEELGIEGRRLIRVLGRIGYFGRALAYGLVGLFVTHSAATHDPEAGRGLDGALRDAQQSEYGTVLLLAVTVGFAAFGVFRLLEARYTRDAT